MTNYFLRFIQAIPLFFLAVTASIAQPSTDMSSQGYAAPEMKNIERDHIAIPPHRMYDTQISLSEDDPRSKSQGPKPPIPRLDRNRIEDPEYVAGMWWQQYGYPSKEAAAVALKKQKISAEFQGDLWFPVAPSLTESLHSVLQDSDKPLPPLPRLDPNRINDLDYVAGMWWRHYGYLNKKQALIELKKQKKIWDEGGLTWKPPQPGNPDYVDEYFAMPSEEEIGGCTYVRGYSYPDICRDDNGHLIFDSSKDSQAVLDKLVKSQHKVGKYNKMPKEKPKSTVIKAWVGPD